MLNIHFTKLIDPAVEIAEAFNRWKNRSNFKA